jgi:RNA polymerase sigma-70 factor (ECF subfamily)
LLIDQARRGDAAAWEVLVRQHQEVAFRLAYLLLGDVGDAEEVSQDAFVHAFLALDRFDGERPFKPWLLQIVRNLAKNRLRSLSRYWQMVQRWRQVQKPAVEPAPVSQDEAALLWQAVQKLRPAAQEIIYLRYFLEMSEAETAVTLNVPSGTVKSRLHRALKQLKVVIKVDFAELYDG